jgi:hypothetical protein
VLGASSLSLCVFADLAVVSFIASASPLLNSEWSIRTSSPEFNPLLKVTRRDRSGYNVTANPLLLANTTVHTQVIDTRPLYTAWSSVQQVTLQETELRLETRVTALRGSSSRRLSIRFSPTHST